MINIQILQKNIILPIIRHFLWSSMLTSQFWKVFYTDTHHKAAKMILVSRIEDIRKPASTEGEKHISKWFQKVTLNFKEILNFFEGPQAPRDVSGWSRRSRDLCCFLGIYGMYIPQKNKTNRVNYQIIIVIRRSIIRINLP